MKSKLFLIVLLLAAITTIGISQEKQIIPPKGFVLEGQQEPATEVDKAREVRIADEVDKAMAERARISKLPVNIQNLVGVKGIYVLIEGLGENAKSPGFTRELLKTDVELKLRLAGIKVNSKEEWFTSADRAYIYVNITTVDVNEIDHMIYSIIIKLVQRVGLLRAPYMTVFGATWDSSGTVIRSKSKFLETARQSVKDHMDLFINDYLTANPKK